MSKHLILGASANNWRLPADADRDALLSNMEYAMKNGTSLRVAVEMGDDPLNRGTVLVNGGALEMAAVVEIVEPDE